MEVIKYMENYGDLNHDAPWRDSAIKKVVIEDGVTKGRLIR